jgi:prepilin-type N-terminal cleavage/methylation domain-containing protein
MTPSLCRTQRGFSLVELIVVIAIIAILAVIGASVLSGSNVTISSAATQVSASIAGARQLAISKNCRTRFIIVTNKQTNRADWRLNRYAVLRVPENYADTTGTSAFVQVTELAELGSGVYFRDNIHKDANVTAPKSMLDPTYVDTTRVNGEDIEYAYIEFLPTGQTARTSTENIFEIEKAPTADISPPNNMNYVRIGVSQYTGRVKFQRPGLK